MATATRTEVWRPVADLAGYYEVSNLGRVKSLERQVVCRGNGRRTVPERILKAQKNKKGYWQVCLYMGGKKHWRLVHRLVAEAFIPRPEGCNIVNHKDSNTDHNWADNVEWVTPLGNVRHSILQRRRIARSVIRSDGRYYPIMRMVEEDGFRSGDVCRCCQGKRKTHGGYGWRYAKEGGLDLWSSTNLKTKKQSSASMKAS